MFSHLVDMYIKTKYSLGLPECGPIDEFTGSSQAIGERINTIVSISCYYKLVLYKQNPK